jgi:single-stranded DNA-binding protein
MGYDKNECRFSGQVLELKNVPTRSGKKMATLKIQCFREQIRACCFENYAEIILENFDKGDQIEFAGKLQTSSWEKNGSKYFSFQINIGEIAGHQVEEKPRAGT